MKVVVKWLTVALSLVLTEQLLVWRVRVFAIICYCFVHRLSSVVLPFVPCFCVFRRGSFNSVIVKGVEERQQGQHIIL
jgi:hypothetical protein